MKYSDCFIKMVYACTLRERYELVFLSQKNTFNGVANVFDLTPAFCFSSYSAAIWFVLINMQPSRSFH